MSNRRMMQYGRRSDESTGAIDPSVVARMGRNVELLGYDIVETAGVFSDIAAATANQKANLAQLNVEASKIEAASALVRKTAVALNETTAETSQIVDSTLHSVRQSSETAQDLAAWVRGVSDQTNTARDALVAMRKSNSNIAAIARKVNILAINAKIEAAGAGDAGLGFAVVADAINELSKQTSDAAMDITQNLESLRALILQISEEAQDNALKASGIIEQATQNDTGLSTLETRVSDSASSIISIVKEAENMQRKMEAFAPVLHSVADDVDQTSSSIQRTSTKIESLVDRSEEIVQDTSALGISAANDEEIAYAMSAAQEVSAVFERELARGAITADDLFDTQYTVISGTNPEQVRTRFTAFTDRVLPDIQEKALTYSDKVVFCAAVDRNGYLPTHNKKFSAPQGEDPVWNTANCRNRRIFDDRVGLKAGRNTARFLLQVYRRDMGGGSFLMMKDISAPIMVQGRHWGGLRFAVKF